MIDMHCNKICKYAIIKVISQLVSLLYNTYQVVPVCVAVRPAAVSHPEFLGIYSTLKFEQTMKYKY